MDNRLTKIAAIALVTLSAAAPMAMASAPATAKDPNSPAVSVVPLGRQPDQPFLRADNAVRTNLVDTVKVESLGPQPRQPFSELAAGPRLANRSVVTEGNPSGTRTFLN